MTNTRTVSKQSILDWIDEQQKGKPGIYPYHVACSVAERFNITITEARKLVQEHIRKVIGELND